MPEQRFEAVSVIGPSLERYLETRTVYERLSIQESICKSLKEVFDNTPQYIAMIDFYPPGRPDRRPSDKDVDDPRHGDDDEDREPGEIMIILRTNPYRQEILDKALRWDCDWAKGPFPMQLKQKKTSK